MTDQIELVCPLCGKAEMTKRDDTCDPLDAVRIELVCPDCPNDIHMHPAYFDKDNNCIEWGRN
jgi:hypothetical protein